MTTHGEPLAPDAQARPGALVIASAVEVLTVALDTIPDPATWLRGKARLDQVHASLEAGLEGIDVDREIIALQQLERLGRRITEQAGQRVRTLLGELRGDGAPAGVIADLGRETPSFDAPPVEAEA